MKVTDGAVARARAVFAARGPIPPDDVLREALEAALRPLLAPGRRQRGKRKPRSGQPSAQAVQAAQREADRNRRLVEAGETFASHKPSDWRVK